MSLNIKNERTCQLADELSRLTGETKTGAITVALEERLEREQRQRSMEERLRRMRAISKPLAALSARAGHRSTTASSSTTSGVCRSDRRYVGDLAILFDEADADRYDSSVAARSSHVVANFIEATIVARESGRHRGRA